MPPPFPDVTTAQQLLQSRDKYDVCGVADKAVYLVGVDDLSHMGSLALVSAPPPASTTLTANSTSVTSSLSASTTTPIFVPRPSQSSGSYSVFGMPQQGLVKLFGVDDLPRMVWNTSQVH